MGAVYFYSSVAIALLHFIRAVMCNKIKKSHRTLSAIAAIR